jgi:mannosyltransferase
VLLVAVTALAGLLRFYKLGQWSFWIDEIFTLGRVQAHYSTLEATLRNVPPQTNWIPFSLLFTSGFLQVLGVSEWTVRLAPAIIGTLSVPILYWPVRKYFSIRVALIFALLLAISPWHIQWSQNARFYPALMLFYNLALFATFWGVEEDRPLAILSGIAFFYLALSERILGFFLVPVVISYLLCVWLLPFEKPAGFHLKNLSILALPLLIGLIVEGLSWLTAGTSRFFGDFGDFIGSAIDSPVRILILIFFSIGLPIVAIAPFSGGWLMWQRSRGGLLLLLAAIVPVFLLISTSAYLFTVERYALITLPAWLVLSAVAVDRLASWLPRHGSWVTAALLTVFLSDAAGSLLMYYQLNNGNRPDWRGAFQYVEQRMEQNDLIVSPWPEIGHYYLGVDTAIEGLNDIDTKALATGDRRVWFVVDSEAVWFAGRNKQWMEENAELLFVWYLRMREQIDMKVYRYDPPRNSMD